MSRNLIRLRWRRYSKLTDARADFAKTPCIDVQAKRSGKALRVGKASKGLTVRYRGGTGYALDAAMHGSRNRVYVAAVNADECDGIEKELIWSYRKQLIYNNLGKAKPPPTRLQIVHDGDAPTWD